MTGFRQICGPIFKETGLLRELLRPKACGTVLGCAQVLPFWAVHRSSLFGLCTGTPCEDVVVSTGGNCEVEFVSSVTVDLDSFTWVHKHKREALDRFRFGFFPFLAR